MKRIARRIHVKPDRLEGYKQQHANIWPSIANAIEAANLHNYSIHYLDGELFAYMEYTGDDYAADMKRLGESEDMKQWCRICSEMQVSPGLPDGTWVDMEEVFYQA